MSKIKIREITDTYTSPQGGTKTTFVTEDDQQLFTWSRVEIGEEYEGEIIETEWGRQFRKVKPPGAAARGRSTEERNEIIRQSTLGYALRYFEIRQMTEFTVKDWLTLGEILTRRAKNELKIDQEDIKEFLEKYNPKKEEGRLSNKDY